MFWLITGAFALLFAFLGEDARGFNPTTKLLFRILLIITLAIPIGFGGLSAEDHSGYANNYNELSLKSISDILHNYNFIENTFVQREDTYEVGFMALIIILGKVGFTEAAFFFFIALFTSSLYVSVFYRFRLTPLIILIFLTSVYFSQQANLVRQMIAVTLFLYSIRYLNKNEIWKYALVVLLASTFHSSAILLLFFIPLYLLKSTNAQKTIWFLLTTFWIVSLPIGLRIIDVNLFGILPSVMHFSVSMAEAQILGAEINFDIVYNSFALFVFSIRKTIPDRHLHYYILFIVGAILLNISQQMILLYRFALYFAPLLCVIIPNSTLIRSKWPTSLTRVLRYTVVLYYTYVFLSSMVFSQNPPFTRDMYSLSDLFM